MIFFDSPKNIRYTWEDTNMQNNIKYSKELVFVHPLLCECNKKDRLQILYFRWEIMFQIVVMKA